MNLCLKITQSLLQQLKTLHKLFFTFSTILIPNNQFSNAKSIHRAPHMLHKKIWKNPKWFSCFKRTHFISRAHVIIISKIDIKFFFIKWKSLFSHKLESFIFLKLPYIPASHSGNKIEKKEKFWLFLEWKFLFSLSRSALNWKKRRTDEKKFYLVSIKRVKKWKKNLIFFFCINMRKRKWWWSTYFIKINGFWGCSKKNLLWGWYKWGC